MKTYTKADALALDGTLTITREGDKYIVRNGEGLQRGIAHPLARWAWDSAW